MDFENSSQRKRWLYTAEKLAEERESKRQAFLEQCKASPADPDMITLAEEAGLLRHYQEKLISVYANLKLPRKVLSTSVNFLKRFYIKRSSLETDPQPMALACLYLACKVEDCYISATELGRLVGMPQEILLRLELILLDAIEFDLQIHSLYRALDGCLNDFTGWMIKDDEHELKMDEFKAAAHAFADTLLLTDALLLFTPGQIGLCCLRHALLTSSSKVDFGQYLEHVAGQAGENANKNAIVSGLSSQLDAAAALVEQQQGGSLLQIEDVAGIDRRLKSFIKKNKSSKNDGGKKAGNGGGGKKK